MDSLEVISSMKKISFFFFALLGAAHFFSGMLASSGIFEKQTLLITRILVTPFLLVSLSYAYTVLKEHLLINGKKGRGLDYIFLGLGIISLVGFVVLEIAFPDTSLSLS